MSTTGFGLRNLEIGGGGRGHRLQKVEFKIAQTESGGAQVTWTLSGDADFMTKMMSGLGLLDDMIGKDFEKGLAQLKTVAEGK